MLDQPYTVSLAMNRKQQVYDSFFSLTAEFTASEVHRVEEHLKRECAWPRPGELWTTSDGARRLQQRLRFDFGRLGFEPRDLEGLLALTRLARLNRLEQVGSAGGRSASHAAHCASHESPPEHSTHPQLPSSLQQPEPPKHASPEPVPVPVALKVGAIAVSTLLASEPRSGVFGTAFMLRLSLAFRYAALLLVLLLPVSAPLFFDQHNLTEVTMPEVAKLESDARRTFLRPPLWCSADWDPGEECLILKLDQPSGWLALYVLLTSTICVWMGSRGFGFLAIAVVDTARRYRSLYCWGQILMPDGWPAVPNSSASSELVPRSPLSGPNTPSAVAGATEAAIAADAATTLSGAVTVGDGVEGGMRGGGWPRGWGGW